MCGICGIWRAHGPVDEAVLHRMCSQIVHRGPDGEGFTVHGPIGLGMRRLAIIDVAGGWQPIANEDGSLEIVFNGEIYNYVELREELLQRGHVFRTHSDTETIVHAYEEYGLDCLQHLNGMFAFALWDQRRERLWLARDRLGEKPLFYRWDGQQLIFASELKAILPALDSLPELDLEALDHYLSFQYVPAPYSILRSIRKLPAAHYLLLEKGHCTTHAYWDLSYSPPWTDDEATLQARLREEVTRAIRWRLRSDVPLGAFLSSGMDSAVIVATMARLLDRPVKAYTVAFNEEGFDESGAAHLLAQYVGAEHIVETVRLNVLDDLPRLVPYLDEPFADSAALPTYYLSKVARQSVTVALSGDGGDEIFAGYQRYTLDRLAAGYRWVPPIVRNRLVPAVANRLDIARPVSIEANYVLGLRRLTQVMAIPEEASILRWGSYFSEPMKARLFQPELLARLQNTPTSVDLLAATYRRSDAPSRLGRTLYADLKYYLPDDGLVKVDRMSMANSLEVRVPFLDHQLVEFVARLPERYKVRGLQRKVLFRRAFRADLPPGWDRRPKRGFDIPLSLWFRGELYDWLRSTLRAPNAYLNAYFRPAEIERLLTEHRAQRDDHARRLWTLLVFELWLQHVHQTTAW